MNKLILLSHVLLSVFIFSCSEPSNHERLISNYVQTVRDTKTDMKFKLIEISEAGTITNRDSLAIILSEFFIRDFEATEVKKIMVDTIITNSESKYEYLVNVLQDFRFKLDSVEKIENDLKKQKLSEIDRALKNMSVQNSKTLYMETIYKWSLDSIEDKERLTNLKRLNQKESEILAKGYNVKYSIENPVLNGAKQEITRKFYFDPEVTKILFVE